MQEALDMGYKDVDAFVEAGGDPDKHVSAHEFVRYGKLQKSMREQNRRFEAKQQEYEQRFEQLNKMHSIQMEQEINKLKAQQRSAVEDADPEAYDRAQQQIEAIQEKASETTQVAPAKDPAVVEWESRNPWINDPNDPKAPAAQGIWYAYIQANPNATVESALAHVDQQLAKLAPPTNPLRDMPSASEAGTRTSSRKKTLTMSDLSHEERNLWNTAGHSIWGGDEKAFLKSAADARK